SPAIGSARPRACRGMPSDLLKESHVTSTLDTPPLTDFERELPTEAADIDEIVRGMRAIQEQAAVAGNRPLSRGTHAKGICVAATFEVLDLHQTGIDPSVAQRLAQGIFAVPGKYPATVSFANADGGHRPDRWPDVRAMSFAIALAPGVIPGTTRLDYSMNSSTTFPINDAHA